MKTSFRILMYSMVIILTFSAKPNLTTKESSFSKSLVSEKCILPLEEGWWNWEMASINVENGKLHVLKSTILNFGSWMKNSKIVGFTADSPEEPDTFINTTFLNESFTYKNLQVLNVGVQYFMVYLVKYRTTPRLTQQIGIATKIFLNQSWIESSHDLITKASNTMDGSTIVHVFNPTFLVDKDCNYRTYYKSITDKYYPERFREISKVINKKIKGSYENYGQNPHILWKSGTPQYLFNICYDEDAKAGYYLNIDGWNYEENLTPQCGIDKKTLNDKIRFDYI